MWLFITFIFFVLFGALAVVDDAKVIYCEHEYEYDGDSFSYDDAHYGRYYICKKCGHEKFICYKDWNNMKDCNSIKYEYWKNRPYTEKLKEYIIKNGKS